MDIDLLAYRLADDNMNENQEDINDESLYLYDHNKFINLLKSKTSVYIINDYINEFKDEDEQFWFRILREVIDIYSLNCLKMFFSDITSDELPQDMKQEIKNLILFLKGDLQDYIKYNKMMSNLSVGEFTVGIKSLNVPYLFKWFLIYTDIITFNTFLNLIVSESNLIEYDNENY